MAKKAGKQAKAPKIVTPLGPTAANTGKNFSTGGAVRTPLNKGKGPRRVASLTGSSKMSRNRPMPSGPAGFTAPM